MTVASPQFRKRDIVHNSEWHLDRTLVLTFVAGKGPQTRDGLGASPAMRLSPSRQL
jgi:hypothetical protein